jgi:hypothetical protein
MRGAVYAIAPVNSSGRSADPAQPIVESTATRATTRNTQRNIIVCTRHVQGGNLDCASISRRQDAEPLTEDERGDDPEVAMKLRIEERELHAGELN